jgi:hypothetical protein
MKQNSQLPKDNLTEIRGLFEATKQGGKDAPVAFQKLFQYLLSQTILADAKSVRLYRLGSHSFVLSGFPHPKAESNASSEIHPPGHIHATIRIWYGCAKR